MSLPHFCFNHARLYMLANSCTHYQQFYKNQQTGKHAYSVLQLRIQDTKLTNWFVYGQQNIEIGWQGCQVTRHQQINSWYCQINTTKVESNLIWQVILLLGTFNIWGKMSRHLGQCLPRYLSNTDNHSLFVAMASNYDYTYFACDISRWDGATKAIWGSHDICPSSMQFQVLGITSVGLSIISQAEAWGNPKRPLYGMAYLFLAPAQEAEEERRFGLVGVWVHPNQTLLPSLEEAVKKLALLINTKEDWHYAFLWVREDLQHIPLYDTRHISILVDGSPSRSACGWLIQTEVHQLLHLGSEMVYPEGLNGGLELVQVTLTKLPSWEVESTGETTWLQITLPRTTQGNFP